MPDRKQIRIALISQVETWLNDGVDIEDLIEVLEAIADELNTTALEIAEAKLQFILRKR